MLVGKEQYVTSLHQTDFGNYQPLIDEALRQLGEKRILERIWQQDPSLWPSASNSAKPELGWLGVMDELLADIQQVNHTVEEVCAENFTHVVLIGMGGASMASEVLCATFGVKPGYLELIILDTTSPTIVHQIAETLDPLHTLFLLCSKSGNTVETSALFAYFRQWVAASIAPEDVGKHFVAITDPGSEIELLAIQNRFRAIFRNHPAIAGHYSALSYFGMVPAAFAGIDIIKLLHRGSEAAEQTRNAESQSPALQLAALLTAFARAGRNKITFVPSTSLSRFGIWLEQLIAVSFGKSPTNLVPVQGEALLKPRFYGTDRLFIYLRMVGDSAYDTALQQLQEAGQPVLQVDITHLSDLGAAFFDWQMAAALACHLLFVNPFEQPVLDKLKTELTAQVTKRADDSSGEAIVEGENLADNHLDMETTSSEALMASLERVFFADGKNDESAFSTSYVALLSFLPPSPEIGEALHELRTQIQRRTQRATIVHPGARLLHSTIETHVYERQIDVRRVGIFLQFVADEVEDLLLPGLADMNVPAIQASHLTRIQSNLTRQTLCTPCQPFLSIQLGRDPIGALAQVTTALQNLFSNSSANSSGK